MKKNIQNFFSTPFFGVSMAILALILGCISYLYPPTSTVSIKVIYVMFIFVYFFGIGVYAIMVNVKISDDKVISYDEQERTLLIKSRMNYENGRMATLKYEDKQNQILQPIAIGYVDEIHHNGTISIKLTHKNTNKLKNLNIEISSNQNLIDKLKFRPYICYSDINDFELIPKE